MAHDVLNGLALPINAGSAGQPESSSKIYEGDTAMIIASLRAMRAVTNSSGKVILDSTTVSIQGTSCGGMTIEGTSVLANCNALKTAVIALNTALYNHGIVGA
jgi:hypothetical protein